MAGETVRNQLEGKIRELREYSHVPPPESRGRCTSDDQYFEQAIDFVCATPEVRAEMALQVMLNAVEGGFEHRHYIDRLVAYCAEQGIDEIPEKVFGSRKTP